MSECNGQSASTDSDVVFSTPVAYIFSLFVAPFMAEVYSWLKPLLCVKLDAKAVKGTCVGVAVDCYMNQKLGPRSEEIRGLKPWKFGYADNFIGTRAIGDKKPFLRNMA